MCHLHHGWCMVLGLLPEQAIRHHCWFQCTAAHRNIVAWRQRAHRVRRRCTHMCGARRRNRYVFREKHERPTGAKHHYLGECDSHSRIAECNCECCICGQRVHVRTAHYRCSGVFRAKRCGPTWCRYNKRVALHAWRCERIIGNSGGHSGGRYACVRGDVYR